MNFYYTGDFPVYWDTMPPNTTLHVVDLQPGSKEFKEVVSKFEQTMKKTATLAGSAGGIYNSIIQIRRIQNLTLFAQFIAKKSNMDKNNKPGHQNEMQLYHGTSADTCPKINLQGFNRSFSGKNGKFTCSHHG